MNLKCFSSLLVYWGFKITYWWWWLYMNLIRDNHTSLVRFQNSVQFQFTVTLLPAASGSCDSFREAFMISSVLWWGDWVSTHFMISLQKQQALCSIGPNDCDQHWPAWLVPALPPSSSRLNLKMNSSHQSLSGPSFSSPDGWEWLMSLHVIVQPSRLHSCSLTSNGPDRLPAMD